MSVGTIPKFVVNHSSQELACGPENARAFDETNPETIALNGSYRGGYKKSRAEIAATKAICARCSVRPACLKDALEYPDDLGVRLIRGGLTTAERNRLRQRGDRASLVLAQASQREETEPAAAELTESDESPYDKALQGLIDGGYATE